MDWSKATKNGMNTQKTFDPQHLRHVLRSLNDNTGLLVVDTKRCAHSQRLLDEMRIASSLVPDNSNKATALKILDLSVRDSPTLSDMSWLPGVPCLIMTSKVFLGVDAFNKIRNFTRSENGIVLHTIP
jgi:hypothetical protein